MKVEKSNLYRKFKRLDDNREVNEAHVKNLMSSITERNLLSHNPIIVNERMEILDGQHRFEACKRLKVDVYYTTVKGGDIALARLLNRVNQQWKLMDYAMSYALSGAKNYPEFLKFCADYNLTVSVALELVTGKFTRESAMRFKKGDLIIKDMDEAVETIEKVYRLKPFCETGMLQSRVLIRALRLMKDSGIDFEKLIEKLKHSGILITPETHFRALLRQFEDILNYKVKKNTKRLY